jgi:tetratricopeptide (TPR) repeat protein
MRVIAAGVLAAGLLALAPVFARAPQTQAKPGPSLRGPSTREVLDQYLKGEHEAAVGNPPRLARFNFEDAERWMTAGGQAQTERRRLAASLFALEYAGARQGVLPAMINWARGVMSRQPPRPIEALWLRASIALAEGLDRWIFLVEGVGQTMASGKPGPVPVGHIRFARTRFPDDPHFQMAEAIGAEVSASRPLDRLSGPPIQSGTGWDRIATERLEAGGLRLPERTAALDRAAGLLERLASHETLAAEANLRLGYVRLRQSQSDAALAHFDRVASLTKNVSLRYLGHLYSGWTLGALGRTQEAAAAYRAALRMVPRAQTATALLLALLARSDQLTEAEAAAEEFLVADVAPIDPWRTYHVGDFPEYPRLVRQLREALR